MDKLEKIREGIEPILLQHQVQLYELNLEKAKKNPTLIVSIMFADGSMDLDTCATVSEQISILLDDMDFIDGEYTLEVCSPGVERVLRTFEEIHTVVSKSVYIQFKEKVKDKMEIQGTLISYEDKVLTISYRDKAATRKLELSEDNIYFIRLAV